MKGVKVVISIFLILSFDIGSSLVFAYTSRENFIAEKSGPIGIRNQMPLYLFYLQMAPDKARVIERNKFSVDMDYTISNVTVSSFTPQTSLYDIDIDMEVSRITLDFRYGLYDNLELGLELPYISLSRGYLDNFIESFEDGIGARTPRSREHQGSYEFDYSFIYNNTYLIRKQHSSDGLGDIVLNAKYLLFEDEGLFRPNVSIRSAIKFPTAEKDDLLGSGELDYGFGLLVDKGFFNRVFIYAGANIVMIEKPSFFSVLGLEEDIFSGMLAMEYFFTKRFSLVTQVSGNTTPYPESSTNVLDNDAYEFAFGLNYRCKEKDNVSWHLAFVENIKSASSPDASFHLGLKWEF